MRTAGLMMLMAPALGGAAPAPGQAVTDSPRPAVDTPEVAAAIAGPYFALDSKSVGRRFHIFVKLPDSYGKEPARRYTVSYILDGDSLFPMLAPEHLFLNYDEGLPEAIIVGIAYGGFTPDINKRDIDFRPMLEDGSVGGAPKFLAMLESELLPRIDAAYRTDPERRTLFGQSRGGAFVLYAADQRPGLFHAFIASNPGREWNGHLHGFDRAPTSERSGGMLIVASGTRDRAYLREGAIEWGKRVTMRTDLPWHAELVDIPGGTHAASVTRAYRAGMLRAFGIKDQLP